MPQDGERLGASAPVSELRPCRLLRSVAKQARNQTLSRDPAPNDAQLRARRRLGLVLRRRDLHRARAASARSHVDKMSDSATWPRLALDEWQATYDTLHMWTQIV